MVWILRKMLRNIPAYAGKTTATQPSLWDPTEHPRVCGENRGVAEAIADLDRNIPAYAGKTVAVRHVQHVKPEHPRVCGENAQVTSWCLDGGGTSPRMRGKHVSGYGVFDKERNIPAYAGKTLLPPLHKRLEQEHPRVCGENRMIPRSATFTLGTSPRMRGKLDYNPRSQIKFRNIPAYAGKTGGNDLDRQIFEEHPRVCGENHIDWLVTDSVGGTSPRMRGKPHRLACHR